MVIEVIGCEGCPFWSVDIDNSEYCSRGANPEERFIIKEWRTEETIQVNDIPNNCPLQDEAITVILNK